MNVKFRALFFEKNKRITVNIIIIGLHKSKKKQQPDNGHVICKLESISGVWVKTFVLSPFSAHQSFLGHLSDSGDLL